MMRPEDWSNLFCARDEDEEEYIPADESSDSDSNLEPMAIRVGMLLIKRFLMG